MRSDIQPEPTRRTVLTSIGGLAALAGARTVSADSHGEADVTVTVRSFEFDPATVEITAGDTVRWVWEEGSHNVSPTGVPDGADWEGDDDQTYGGGHEYSHTFETPGTYEYVCQPHASSMQGTVQVTEAQTSDAPATVTFGDQRTRGGAVVVDSVRMDDGGFVTIHDSSLLDGEVIGSVVGVSEYFEGGTHEDLTVELDDPLGADDTLIAMPHRDTNGNETYDFVETEGEEDGAYLTPAGDPVTDAGEVTVAAEAAVTFSDQQTPGGTVVVDSVRMDDGGFVTIHDSRLLDGEPLASVVGVSDYVEGGTHETVTVTLDEQLAEAGTLIAMPHRDTDGDEAYGFVETEGGADGPYLTLEDEAVVDDAEITIGPAAEVTFTDQSIDGASVVVDSVRMNAGGFVTIHDSRLFDGEPLASVVGVSGFLEPGRHENVTVELDDSPGEEERLVAMPHRDTNGNGTYDFVDAEGGADGPYLTPENEAVVDDATVAVETIAMDETDTGDGTDGDGGADTTDNGATDTATETPGEDGPGFGLLATLAGLGGALAYGARKVRLEEES